LGRVSFQCLIGSLQTQMAELERRAGICFNAS